MRTAVTYIVYVEKFMFVSSVFVKLKIHLKKDENILSRRMYFTLHFKDCIYKFKFKGKRSRRKDRGRLEKLNTNMK